MDRSIVEPEIFLTTNVIGTQTLLDAAKRHWKVDPEDKHSREFRPGVRYLQVSTDEVYGALGKTGMFQETTPLSPTARTRPQKPVRIWWFVHITRPMECR